MPKPFAFVAGTALLDIISTITDFRYPLDAIGTTTLNFGGVAYNVAVNLRAMDIPVTLMTALNNSPISQMMKNELENNDIRLHLQNEPTIADGIYSGHFLAGEERTNVWSNILEKITFSQKFIEKGMKNAACAILTNCLNVDTINNCIAVANKFNIPVFLSGASLMESHKFVQINGDVALIFANEGEINQLQVCSDLNSPQEFVDTLKTSLVMTRGAKGVTVYRHAQDPLHLDIASKDVVKNSLGAGDLFMAATVQQHFFAGIPLLDAVTYSLNIAPKILEREDANIGKKRALEDNISSISVQAERDKLTGLLNRHGLERMIKNKQLGGKPFHIVLCDVDHFKSFNDTYGHDVGDVVLAEVSKAIDSCLRSQDAVARWSGEEFICLIDGGNQKRAVDIAERIRTTIASLQGAHIPRQITISAGIAKSGSGKKVDHIIKAADNALYQAKNAGRNTVVVASC